MQRFVPFALFAAAVLFAGGLAAAERPQAVAWIFEDSKLGQLPGDWQADKTGEGPGSAWKVMEDTTAPKGPRVLAQTSSEGPKPLFNLCVLKEPVLADVDLSLSFKAVRGKIDQGGGPVWRYQDNKNYYVCRMNPLEANFRLYHVVDGKRVQLATADADAEQKTWHTIRVMHKGAEIQCWFDGELLFKAKDDAIRGAGRVGLWTKADAVTSFDGFEIKAAP